MPRLGTVEYLVNERGVATRIKCPLVDDWIEDVDCMENQCLPPEFIPERFKALENWKEVCDRCPFRDY